MTFDEYLTLMDHEYFYICKNKNVIEIGPGTAGIHSRTILKNDAKSLIIIEPDPKVKLLSESITIIRDDVIKVLSSSHPAEIVVCCGVLYHLHSPLHLLELIANNCDPNYVILDCVNDPEFLRFNNEHINKKGNRQTAPMWKSCNFNLVIPFEVINESMNHLGYTLIKINKLSVNDYFPKSNSWVGLWSKNK